MLYTDLLYVGVRLYTECKSAVFYYVIAHA